MIETVTLPYGHSTQEFSLIHDAEISYYYPRRIDTKIANKETINNAIRKSTIYTSFCSKISPNGKIVITVNDKTRPVPNNLLFPPLLEEFQKIGAKKENITILIASGSHSPMRDEEYDLILPAEIVRNFKIISHNCDSKDELISKGTTSRGTPVYVNRIFDEADIRIVVGDIEPHHFAGFSGGVKSAAIGLCGRETINSNHSLLLDPRSCVGNYDENPLRQDIEEIGELIRVDYALNAVLNDKKELVDVIFDLPKQVMQKGIGLSKQISMVKIGALFDLVIASAGGYPKDINFYQAQKALTHASMFCKPGGMVILLAECSEGIGNQQYFDFMQNVPDHKSAIKKFSNSNFSVGPHKAFQVAQIAAKVEIRLCSSIPPSLLNQILIEPIRELSFEINSIVQKLPKNSRIAILPFATQTIPVR
jgi:nickel-dependent lactate racemase